jgi:hypothetical protein
MFPETRTRHTVAPSIRRRASVRSCELSNFAISIAEDTMPGILAIYTLLHVAISLVAIGSGFAVMFDWLRGRENSRWTSLFLTMTILTSVTGFGFPAPRLTPAHVFGVVSLIALGMAVYGLYTRKLSGNWRTTYLVAALFSQYLNVVVLIVQSYQKLPVLRSLAPTQTEPVFLATQALTLIAFLVIGVRLVFRPRVSAAG